jgi:hypothetical protein
MKPSIPLRIASIVSFFYCAGHTSGAPWMSPEGPETVALSERMQSYRFDIMGSTRTVWDFHFGFGVIISVYLFVQAVILWQVAAVAKDDAHRARPLIATLTLASFGNAILVSKYFFAAPLVMAVTIVVCLVLSYWAARQSVSAVSRVP